MTVAPAEPRHPTQCVVLSGGGASGAYEVGVLKALLTKAQPPLDPLVFAGTSIGSFNAAFLVSQWDWQGRSAVANLETLWIETLSRRWSSLGRASGMFRFRGNPVDLLDPTAYLPNPLRPFLRLAKDGVFVFADSLERVAYLVRSDEPLPQRAANLFDVALLVATDSWQEITRGLDFSAIRHSTRQLQIATTDWNSGELRVFANRDLTNESGPLVVQASAAVPGLLPAVYMGSEPHVDGGVVMNTPLALGIRAGADELHVVYLDPDVRAIPQAALNSTLDSSYRQQVISWAKVVNDDIEDARWINRRVQALERLREASRVEPAEVSQLAREMGLAERRLLTIHRYHPRDDLAGGALGMLNFDRQHVAHLIERGFDDATHHDCAESGCVLPGGDGPVPAAAPGSPDGSAAVGE
jgi:NTE family protein